MASVSDRFNQFRGRTRWMVCRVFLHLAGNEVAPVLGVLNQVGLDAMEQQGDMERLGEGLAEICTTLLRYETFWRSAANEGDVVWEEGEAADWVEELFVDSAQRYLSGDEGDGEEMTAADWAVAPVQNVVVMLTLAATGEVPELETDLSSVEALRLGLRAIASLHSQNRLRAIQVHFSPADYGEVLDDDQVVEHFPELLPL